MTVTDLSGKSEVISKRVEIETGDSKKVEFFYRPDMEGVHIMIFEIMLPEEHTLVIFDSYTIETEITLVQ